MDDNFNIFNTVEAKINSDARVLGGTLVGSLVGAEDGSVLAWDGILGMWVATGSVDLSGGSGSGSTGTGPTGPVGPTGSIGHTGATGAI